MTMKYYFPSCKFTQMRPETSEKVKRFMDSKGVRVVGCCRPGHKALSGWNDIAITICETCSIIIGENRPAAKVISLYEFIDSLPDFPFPDYKGERITLQDCYRAKAKETEKAAVRSVLRKMNVEVVELPGTEEEINFDGSFLLTAAFCLGPCALTILRWRRCVLQKLKRICSPNLRKRLTHILKITVSVLQQNGCPVTATPALADWCRDCRKESVQSMWRSCCFRKA